MLWVCRSPRTWSVWKISPAVSACFASSPIASQLLPARMTGHGRPLPGKVMADNLSPEHRKLCMSRIRSKDTGPELIVRKIAHQLGYRFRLHRGDLPGKPDLVFPLLKKVILVHGCFWHRHRCNRGRVVPVTNCEYWEEKRTGNVNRDKRTRRELRRLGWRSLVVWECETRTSGVEHLTNRLRSFLCGRRTTIRSWNVLMLTATWWASR